MAGWYGAVIHDCQRAAGGSTRAPAESPSIARAWRLLQIHSQFPKQNVTITAVTICELACICEQLHASETATATPGGCEPAHPLGSHRWRTQAAPLAPRNRPKRPAARSTPGCPTVSRLRRCEHRTKDSIPCDAITAALAVRLHRRAAPNPHSRLGGGGRQARTRTGMRPSKTAKTSTVSHRHGENVVRDCRLPARAVAREKDTDRGGPV